MGSHRDNMFRVYVIHSNCARLHNVFYFVMDYGENGYTLKNVSKNDWKLIKGEGENEDVMGGKKIEKSTIGGTIIRDSRVGEAVWQHALQFCDIKEATLWHFGGKSHIYFLR